MEFALQPPLHPMFCFVSTTLWTQSCPNERKDPEFFLQLLRSLSRHLSPEKVTHKFVTSEAVKVLGVFIGGLSCDIIDGPQYK